MRSLILQSPAKLNLYLRILGRRRDGYHNLFTLFHRISLADTLRLKKKSSGFSLRCSDPRLPTGEGNLITRAYRLLQKKFPKLGGVSVSLKKNIPIGAGLGGGSSNAATFLLGIKKLYGLKISTRELVALGRKIGADVPFFLYGVNQAIGTGKGDRIMPKPARRPQTFLLVISRQGLATKTVYQALPSRFPAVSLTKLTRAATLLCDFLGGDKYDQIAELLRNDLEQTAFRLRPSLRNIIAEFKKQGVPAARMSGSGPTVFAILSRPEKARRLARKLRQDQPSKEFVVCHTC